MKNLTPVALAAKEIRKVLKQYFPKTKFSVRSKNYSMGDHVVIYWVGGPSNTEVMDKTKQFEMGHFDPMTDMYEYDNDIESLPQTKYLFWNRVSEC